MLWEELVGRRFFLTTNISRNLFIFEFSGEFERKAAPAVGKVPLFVGKAAPGVGKAVPLNVSSVGKN